VSGGRAVNKRAWTDLRGFNGVWEFRLLRMGHWGCMVTFRGQIHGFDSMGKVAIAAILCG